MPKARKGSRDLDARMRQQARTQRREQKAARKATRRQEAR